MSELLVFGAGFAAGLIVAFCGLGLYIATGRVIR